MKTSKEEKLIENGSEILKELRRVYEDGILVVEYEKLLNEYKKLNKRYLKTIKFSDLMSREVLNENDSLNDNLKYTIKIARNKLLENVTEHRKTKEASAKFQETIKEFEEALNVAYEQRDELEKKLNYYLEKEDILRPIEYIDMEIEEIIEIEFKILSNKFNLIKLSFEHTNFDKISAIKVYKSIKTNLTKNEVIINDKDNTFYLIIKDKTVEEVDALIKTIYGNLSTKFKNLNFHIGITQFIKEKDTLESLFKRCENAHLLSIKNSKIFFM